MMTRTFYSTMKNALSAGLIIALLGTAVGCTAVASGYDNQPVYRDGGFSRISQQLRQDLRRSGYEVMDIRADEYRGRQVLTVYAKKNTQLYELKYTYPDLKPISSVQKDWSNGWQDKDDYRQSGNKNASKDQYKNNGHYKNEYKKKDDIEDKIKNEARYPAIKRRAINKVEGMGYRVKDIELKKEGNRGVFKIEAKRGSQEYNIVLGYPNLNVITVEKD